MVEHALTLKMTIYVSVCWDTMEKAVK